MKARRYPRLGEPVVELCVVEGALEYMVSKDTRKALNSCLDSVERVYGKTNRVVLEHLLGTDEEFERRLRRIIIIASDHVYDALLSFIRRENLLAEIEDYLI